MGLDLSQLPLADSVPGAVRSAIRHAQLLHDNAAVDKAVDQLAVRLTVAWQNMDPLLVTLLPHGFVLGGMLNRRVVFACRHLAVGADRHGLPDIAEAGLLQGRLVALIVARADTHLCARLHRWAQLQGVEQLLVLAMAGASGVGRDTIAGCEVWHALQVEAANLIGAGFDVEGYGANLPGLYSVAAAQTAE